MCATHLVAAFDPTISGNSFQPSSLKLFPALFRDRGSSWNIKYLKKMGFGTRQADEAHTSEYNGGYLEDCNIVRVPKPWAADASAAKKLWKMSEEMVGEEFEF